MSKHPSIHFIVLSILVLIQNALANSGFYLARDSLVLAGKNTDRTDWHSKIWFTPATDSSFGYVCLGFEYPHLADGMNEMGLVVTHFSGHEQEITQSLAKPTYPGVLSEQVLATCTSVGEVKQLLDKYNLNLFHNSMVMFSDRFGNSMIVEGDTIIKKRHFYQICTNTYQSEYDEDTSPYWQSVPARQMISAADNYSPEFCRSVLAAMQDDMTQYSVVYDVSNLKFSTYLFHDYENSVDFDLKEELRNGRHIRELYTYFPRDSKYSRVYIDRQAPQNNRLIMAFLMFSGLLFLYTLIGWPATHLMNYLDYKEWHDPKPPLNKAKVYAYIICGLLTVYLLALANFREAFQIGLPSSLVNYLVIVKLLVHIPLLVALMIIPLLVMNYRILKQPDQTKYTKWHFTLNTMVYLILLGLFWYWGFIKLYL